MTAKTFFIRLSGLSAATALLLALLWWLAPSAQVHGGFMVLTVLLFAGVCTGLFFAGRRAAQSSSKMAFNNLVSVSVFGKMLLAVAALYIYQQVAEPPNQWFVGIFLSVYVIYTAFEVSFMTKLAKQ